MWFSINKKYTVIILSIILILSIFIVLYLFLNDFNKENYLSNITEFFEKNEIIAANAYFYRFDYINDKEITYKTLLNEDRKLASIINFLKACKESDIVSGLEDKTAYNKGVFVNIETINDFKQFNFRINTENLNIYFPENDTFYKPSENNKNFLKEIFVDQ